MIEVGPEPWDAPDSTRLVGALLVDIGARYAGDAEEGDDHDEEASVTAASVTAPHGAFLVARVDGSAVGCAAVIRHDRDTAELKRMYVAPAARRRGVSRALLAAAEGAACDLGYRRLRLATGLRQPEAMALYESAGYARIDPYGAFAGSPLTVCYERPL